MRLKDLFETSYLFSRGIPISKLEIENRQGIFIFEDSRARPEIEDYRDGKVLVSPQILKTSLEKVKDRLFKAIRERERECLDYQKQKR